MKLTTLACDYCKGVVAAVGSARLMLGPKPSERDPQLDLCRAHLNALLEQWLPARRTKNKVIMKPTMTWEKRLASITRKRERDRETKRATPPAPKGRPRRGGQYWKELEQKVLEVLTVAPGPLDRPVIQKRAGLTQSTAANVVRRLVGRGLVVKTSHGRWARYERRTGAGVHPGDEAPQRGQGVEERAPRRAAGAGD